MFLETERARTFALDEATQNDTVTKRRVRHVMCQLPVAPANGPRTKPTSLDRYGTHISTHITTMQHIGNRSAAHDQTPTPATSFSTQLTVGHDDVDGIVGEGIDLIQLLDLAQVEFDVVVSKLLGVVRLRLLGDGQLLRRHVDADDPSGRSHQLRRNVHVSAGSASQIQHGRALQQVRDAQPAAVVLGHDVGVDGADGGFNMGWHRRRSAAGIGFEVVGRRQRLAVVVRDGVLDLAGLLRTAGGRSVDCSLEIERWRYTVY